MNILVLVAGTNEPSNANVLADHFIEGIKKVAGTEVTKLRLKDLKIQHFDMEHYVPACTTEDDFCKLQELVQAAHGIVIATPIWNFSVPAHLKNVIDRIGAFALDQETHSQGQLRGTPCYFIFTGGAPTPVWKGIMRFTTSHLPEAFRYYGASIVGRYFEGKCMVSKSEFGLVVDKRPKSLRRIQGKGEAFALFVKHFVESGRLPLFYRITSALYNWGQRVVSKF